MRTALLFARHGLSDDAREPLASETIGGIPIVLRQARQCREIGLRRVFVLVERMPPRLAAAIEAIRLDGIAVSAVRTVDAVLSELGEDDTVLMVDEGLLVDTETLSRIMATDHRPALAVWPAESTAGRLAQPLSREHSYGGIALLPVAFLKRSLPAIGDWDPATALPQAALQSGQTAIVDLDSDLGDGGVRYWLRPDSETALASAERLLVRYHAVPGGSPSPAIAAFRHSFVERLVALNVDRPALAILAAAAVLLAVLLFALRLPTAGLAAAAAGIALDAGSRAVRHLRVEGEPARAWDYLRPARVEYVWYAALGAALGGGAITAAATLIPLIALERRSRMIARAVGRAHASFFGASPSWRLVVLAAGAASYSWTLGLLLAAAHAAASLFLHQNRTLRALSPPEPVD